jgi:hypothetical protein
VILSGLARLGGAEELNGLVVPERGSAGGFSRAH